MLLDECLQAVDQERDHDFLGCEMAHIDEGFVAQKGILGVMIF